MKKQNCHKCMVDFMVELLQKLQKSTTDKQDHELILLTDGKVTHHSVEVKLGSKKKQK